MPRLAERLLVVTAEKRLVEGRVVAVLRGRLDFAYLRRAASPVLTSTIPLAPPLCEMLWTVRALPPIEV